MSKYNRTSMFPIISMKAGYFNENTIKISSHVFDSEGTVPIETSARYLDLKSAKELLKTLESAIKMVEQ